MKNRGSYESDIRQNGKAKLEIIAMSRSRKEFGLIVGNMKEATEKTN